jgi:hypothetical protein
MIQPVKEDQMAHQESQYDISSLKSKFEHLYILTYPPVRRILRIQEFGIFNNLGDH